MGLLIAPFIGKADSNQLSETTKLKIELLKVRTQFAQCQANLSGAQLTLEQSKLIGEARKELDAKETDIFDWDKLSFASAIK